MGRLCTAGGFEVIPEQAQQYDLLKFYAFVVHLALSRYPVKIGNGTVF